MWIALGILVLVGFFFMLLGWLGLGILVLLGFFCVILLGIEQLFYLLNWIEGRPKGVARVALLASLGLFLGALNWFVMMSVLTHIGGSGYNGKIEGTHYYVGEHGKYTEVSREVYWFTNAYFTASGFAILLPLAAFFLLVPLAKRRTSRRVAELRRRNDIGALYELVELSDLLLPKGYRDQQYINLYDLREALREKTELAVRNGASPPPALKRPTAAGKQALRDEWLAWIAAHEDQLCQYLARAPTDQERAMSE